MTLAFTDGDGNVGLTQADTLPPFCQTCAHHYNLVGEYQEWKDTSWRVPTLIVPYAYRVPVAEPTGSSPALDGTIQVELTFVVPRRAPMRIRSASPGRCGTAT